MAPSTAPPEYSRSTIGRAGAGPSGLPMGPRIDLRPVRDARQTWNVSVALPSGDPIDSVSHRQISSPSGVQVARSATSAQCTPLRAGVTAGTILLIAAAAPPVTH